MAKRVSTKKATQVEEIEEIVPLTTTPYVVANAEIAPLSPAVAVRHVSNLADFIEHLDREIELTDAFPSVQAYHKFRQSTGIQSHSTGERSLLTSHSHLDASISEYDEGSWNGIEGVLAHLWDKYCGDKIGNQMVANFVFSLLIEGVESGWSAVTKVIREKLGDDAVKDTESIVDGINHLVNEGGADDLKVRINAVRYDLNKPTTDGQKPNIWQKILRGVRFVFSAFTSKKA